MKEKDIGKKIREQMFAHFGTVLHKYPASGFAEIGVSDLFGTLPDGRAIYCEIKRPGASVTSPHVLRQLAWQRREADLGAFCALVSSWEDLEGLLRGAGYRTKSLENFST